MRSASLALALPLERLLLKLVALLRARLLDLQRHAHRVGRPHSEGRLPIVVQGQAHGRPLEGPTLREQVVLCGSSGRRCGCGCRHRRDILLRVLRSKRFAGRLRRLLG